MKHSFEPDVLRAKLIDHMKNNIKPVTYYSNKIGISYRALKRFLEDAYSSRTDTIFKVGKFLKRQEECNYNNYLKEFNR